MRRSFLVYLLVLGASGCEPAGLSSDWERIEPPVAAADFSLPTLDGATAQLSDYRGHVVLMEFWATWCGPCRYSLPSLEVIYQRHRDRGVAVLFINQQETPADIRRWSPKPYTAPILLDERGAVAASYHVSGIPKLFIIDREGRIIYRHEGYGGGLERSLEVILDELLPPSGAGDV